jgi:hypothetical protein
VEEVTLGKDNTTVLSALHSLEIHAEQGQYHDWRDSSSCGVAAREGFASIPLDSCGKAVIGDRHQREIVPGLRAPSERHHVHAVTKMHRESSMVSCSCRIGIKRTFMH